jgi:hypothetical protein
VSLLALAGSVSLVLTQPCNQRIVVSDGRLNVSTLSLFLPNILKVSKKKTEKIISFIKSQEFEKEAFPKI